MKNSGKSGQGNPLATTKDPSNLTTEVSSADILPPANSGTGQGGGVRETLSGTRPPERNVTWIMVVVVFMAFGAGVLLRHGLIAKHTCPTPVSDQPSTLQNLKIPEKPALVVIQKLGKQTKTSPAQSMPTIRFAPDIRTAKEIKP